MTTLTKKISSLNPCPKYRSRLQHKAEAILAKKGDRPLRNQQQRILNRWQLQQKQGGM